MAVRENSNNPHSKSRRIPRRQKEKGGTENKKKKSSHHNDQEFTCGSEIVSAVVDDP